jgi:hypothetical protein
MAFKRFKKLFLSLADFSDPANLLRVINSLQGNIEESLTTLLNKSQNDSNIVTGVKLVAGQNNVINHSLDRNLTGWKVVRQRGQADIWDTQDSNPSTNLTLWLHASANVTVDLEVF